MEVSGQLHASAALPQYPFDRKLRGPQSSSERSGEEKKSLQSPCRESNPGRPARSLVTILTELFRLPYSEGRGIIRCK
jgi:hypothetical protein